MVGAAATTSLNKGFVVCFSESSDPISLVLPLSSHGGFEGSSRFSVVGGSGCGWGLAASARVRGADEWPAASFSSSSPLSAGLGGERKGDLVERQAGGPEFFSKRSRCGRCCSSTAPALPAGLGGEEVDMGFSLKVRASSGFIRKSLEVRLSTALSLLRRLAAGATRGHRDGHAMLDAEMCTSFVLYARIFRRSVVASRPPAQPSGFVPDWDWGGGAASSLQAISELLLACMNASFLRVFVVNCRDHVVILSFSRPSCKSPTAECISRSFWTLSVQKNKNKRLLHKEIRKCNSHEKNPVYVESRRMKAPFYWPRPNLGEALIFRVFIWPRN
jgi:hypothetical protein